MKRRAHQPYLRIFLWLGLFLLLGSPSAHAIPDQSFEWSFELLPAGGAVEGPPGSTVGWGYTITNLDESNWLVLTGISADPFLHGTPTELFDFPILAPEATLSVPYDGVNGLGLYQLTWDLTAQVGFVNSGTFTLSAEWWDEDPLGDGNFLQLAVDQSQPYSATVGPYPVTVVPEPVSLALLGSGLAGLAWMRKRLKGGKEGLSSVASFCSCSRRSCIHRAISWLWGIPLRKMLRSSRV